MTQNILEIKKELRKKYRNIRKNVVTSYKVKASSIVATEGLKLLKNYKIIAAYSPIDSEINVLPLVEILIESKKIVLKPSNNKYYFYDWHNIDQQLIPDAIIVPLITFDSKMNRIGFGKGWYDKVMSRLNGVFKLGIAYEAQFNSDLLPSEIHDQTLDAVLTEVQLRQK